MDPSDPTRPSFVPAYNPPYAAAAAPGPENGNHDPVMSSQQQQHLHAMAGVPLQQQQAPPPTDRMEQEEDDRKPPARESPNNNNNGDAMEVDEEEVIKPVIRPNQYGGKEPRGKPEAMAIALAASGLSEKREELEAEVVVAEPVAVAVEAEVIPTKKAAAKKSPAKRKAPSKGGTSSPSKKTARKKAAPKATKKVPAVERSELLLHEAVPPISDAEYENLQVLMKQFCRVPLLAEFSRPVMLLHPELVATYSKIVTHPVDLGHVCRGIRRRQYKSLRDVRLDMWRVFANCVKFHSHPHNKEAVPSFVSIALHLREYFNNLWQEYMMPSDPVEGASEILRKAFVKRQEDRKKRFDNIAVVHMNQTFMGKIAASLVPFIESGGIVDRLDTTPVFGPHAPQQDRELSIVVENLRKVQAELEQMSRDPSEPELVFGQFVANMKACYSGDVLDDSPSLRIKVRNRLDRFVEKILVPICEANSRGVTQSSIWGNLAAVIWARESSKKPFWPALCLGMLSPPEQREGWHSAITNRNETRLPEKLRNQLYPAKRKCEMAQKRNPLSYFLVEFLGTHEFIWVRETDIVEAFDPNKDPNKNSASPYKKKRSVRSHDMSRVVGSKTYATAVEEGLWASEEFEGSLEDAFQGDADDKKEGEGPAEGDDGEEMNYSYVVLAQSDEEADDEDDHGYQYDAGNMSDTDVEEADYLISHDGKIELGPDGKSAIHKKKAAAPRKKGHDSKSKVDSKKSKSPSKKKKDSKAKEREEKRELRELEKRRRKRLREREKALKSAARKKKRQRTSSDSIDDHRGLQHDKRTRATAIVNGYLARTVAEDPNYRSLGLAGVMQMPAVLVDSTGLLGMSLAFRSAAGELAMPDETDLSRTEPWKAIDADKPKTTTDRTVNLEKQIELVEKEIQRVKSNAQRRKQLTAESVARLAAIQNNIKADDKAARRNHYKKKKKAPSKTGDQSPEDGVQNKVESPSAEPTEAVPMDVDEIVSGVNDADQTHAKEEESLSPSAAPPTPTESQAQVADAIASADHDQGRDSPSSADSAAPAAVPAEDTGGQPEADIDDADDARPTDVEVAED